ncbi:S8 family serine peptidase [Corallococcus aberystwythensis]|uniref:Peptidase S8 n=1 Tax=Corallococcus aberystwythensis TaxID=2316722 RepID=A0A3A8QDL7_9BACT|nr:S8 family serine peptidase [Corallococcus aberystwythensis]RKH61314.1 peptidase S8 [Corallococcus aberystwythensis]
MEIKSKSPASIATTPRTDAARAQAPKAKPLTVRDGFETQGARPSNFVDRPTGRPTPPGAGVPASAFAFGSSNVAVKPGANKVADAKQVDPSQPKPKLTGEPVIAVIDGGVDFKHTDLDDAMWTNPGEVDGDGIDNDNNGIADDIHGFNVGTGKGDPFKGEGTDHGTHVAGIIAAEDNGEGNTGIAAGKAKILSVGGLYDGADLLTNFERSVDYLVKMKTEHGVNIRAANASFGDSYRDTASQKRWEAAIQKLADADILLLAATANGNGSNMNNVPDMPANVDLPNVLTVASMDRNNDKLARFSSHGDKVVDLAAVGEDVLSTVPGNDWEEMSGTSMATPTVAATAARMFAENPDLTAVQVRDLILKTVQQDPDLKGKVITGGKLDIQAAIDAAKATVEPKPQTPAVAAR